ncbi:hypothetical protein AQUCO_00400005v1 [Aquilegia coerulea]|uniref:Uncharacterized protein n=1 Tax=Aquilegia coerulea TaxID=218851 RepID=A0A2G5ESY3_AQUCA|nr:hypothetical protein AQUCO_00400005v1 [Aquilegia coerulea]
MGFLCMDLPKLHYCYQTITKRQTCFAIICRSDYQTKTFRQKYFATFCQTIINHWQKGKWRQNCLAKWQIS